MVDIATFRAVFPEFGDSAKYPDAQVQYYLDFAVQSLRPEAWRNLLERGTGLFVAHYLAMSAISRAGTVPGRGQLGIVASKSVGPASISYDNSAISAQPCTVIAGLSEALGPQQHGNEIEEERDRSRCGKRSQGQPCRAGQTVRRSL